MSILAGVSYATMNAGSGIINFGSTPSAKQRVKCNGADALTLARAILGWTLVSGAWTASRSLQHYSVTGLYATEVGIQPHGRPSGPGAWTKSILDVLYKPAEFLDVGSTDFRDEDLDFSGEMVDLGSTGWTFDGTTEAVSKPVTKLVPMITYTITQYHVSTLPLSTMYGLLGKLNNATFKGATSGKMLYAGGSASRKIIAVLGATVVNDWTIKHKFLFANRNQNHEWRSSTGAFEKIVGASAVTKFELGDFSTLNLGT